MSTLTLIRGMSDKDATFGTLFLDGYYLCSTVEDQFQPGPVKVMHETRIPEGRYQIILRTHGGFHARYSAKFPDMHRGMLQLKDVPRFTDILIHCGNDDDDTSGCVIVGEPPVPFFGRHWVSRSVDTYKAIYPALAQRAAMSDLYIEIKDCDHG